MIKTRVAMATNIVAAISTMKSKRRLVDLLPVFMQPIVHYRIIGFFTQNRVSEPSIARMTDVSRPHWLHVIQTHQLAEAQ